MMAINLDRMVNLHHIAVKVREQKMEVIAGNLANANTPGYKAKAVDFKAAMDKAMQYSPTSNPNQMASTHEKHFNIRSSFAVDTLYRVPDQPDTGDGNTVDAQTERNDFLDNGMRYQASLQFLGGKFSGMKKALGGGQ
jgi:flagellar basal-body rod protein FlgB